LLPGTGGGSYIGNGQCFFSFCCQGHEEEVTQGTSSVFFSFAARDRRRKLHPALPTRFYHRICDRVVQNTQPCHRQTPHCCLYI
jgi:hypothetical protein